MTASTQGAVEAHAGAAPEETFETGRTPDEIGHRPPAWPTAWRLVALRTPKQDEAINEQTFAWQLRKTKLRQVRRREGRYLLRTNLTQEDPVKLWEYYTQLTQVEEAFKNLKGGSGLASGLPPEGGSN